MYFLTTIYSDEWTTFGDVMILDDTAGVGPMIMREAARLCDAGTGLSQVWIFHVKGPVARVLKPDDLISVRAGELQLTDPLPDGVTLCGLYDPPGWT